MSGDSTTVIATALSSEVVGHSSDFNGGRISADTAVDLASRVSAVLADEGWAVVRAETVEVQYGVEATLLIDGGREVQGPKTLEQCQQRIKRQKDKSWVADGRPLNPVLVTRTVTTTPWTPSEEVES